MITLRIPDPGDAAELAAAVGESRVSLRPWMAWAHDGYGLADAARWIERARAAHAADAAWEFLFTDADGRLLGVCGIDRVDLEHRRANLGYWIRQSVAGQGLTPRAVREVADWAFRHTSLHRLEILVAVGNRRSQRVAEKAGATREGVLRARLWIHDVPHDTVVFSLLAPAPAPAAR